MSHDEIQLLTTQLSASLQETPIDRLEVAGLAGLLDRIAPDHGLLSGLDRSLDPGVRADLESGAQRLSEAVEDCDEDTDPAVSWDRLCALDELCAAAHWLGAAELAVRHIEEIQYTLSAFPETWAAHAPAASVLLQRRTPRTGDPARLLWQTVESAALGFQADTANEAGAPSRLRIEVGVDVVIELGTFRAAARRAASAELPEPAPWESLRDAADWSAGITAEDGAVWLVVQADIGVGSAPVSVTRDGETVSLAAHAGAWRCRVEPGGWRLAGGDTVVAFTLADAE